MSAVAAAMAKHRQASSNWRPVLLLTLIAMTGVMESANARTHTRFAARHSRSTLLDGSDTVQRIPAAKAMPQAKIVVQSELDGLPTTEERVAWCEAHFTDLYAQIDVDLARWNETGITPEMMEASVITHTLRSSKPTRKGFVAGFRNGTAILPDRPNIIKESGAGHHPGIFFQYMRVLLDLERLFGAQIPDSDFVINTFDAPGLLVKQGQVPLPVMRFAKSPAHADILIPNFHFYSQAHNPQPGVPRETISQMYPWADRKATVFARFMPYKRYILANDPYTQRKGAGGAKLCTATGGSWGASMTCSVRRHFIDWAAGHNGTLDIAAEPKIPIAEHAQFKYLAHVDGQGLSSRLEQLLPLGSLIFKEDSGYAAFYHHLLQPYKHYVPFWKEGPEDILQAVQWAQSHDSEAEEIGRAAQDFADKYLTRDARACYWLKLLKKYAALLRYVPAKAPQSPMNHFNRPVAQYLKQDAQSPANAQYIRMFAFHP